MNQIASLKDCFSSMNKDLLLMVAELYDVKILKRTKKLEAVEILYKSVMANIPGYLKKLSPHEIYLIRNILDKAPASFYMDFCPQYELPAVILGLIRIHDEKPDEEGKMANYYMFEDVREAIGKCIDDVLDNDLMREYLDFHQYVFGVMNLYGIVPKYLMLEAFCKFPFSSDDRVDDMVVMILDSYMMNVNCVELIGEYKDVFVSPFVDDYEGLWEEIRNCDADYGDFDYEFFMAAGDFPLPVIINDYSEEVEDYLRKYEKAGRFTPQMIDEMFYYIWILSQYDKSPANVMMCVMDMIPEEYKDYASRMFDYVVKALNATPRWCFKGNTPEFMHEHFGGLSRETSSKPSFDNGFISSMYGMTGKKIGRNEPCPCGSGKKFKNCCGRE